jgi:predicted branched-subunit amino acid permease
MRDGFPIGMGYFAVSFSLGIIAAKAGLTAWMGFVGSFLTRASAGEYGVYSLIAIGASYVEVVAMCLVTNLRYLLMSTALTQKFASNVSLLKRILVACCVTDEIFGISIAYPGNLPPAYPFGAMLVSTTMWASGTAVGIVAGEILPPHVVAALSVALYGMFIAIIIPPSKRDYAVGISVIASFLLSWLCSVLPTVREMSAGTRTIVLTIVIAAIAAYVKPIKIEDHDEA